MTKTEREALKRLLSLAAQKEVHLWHHPTNEELRQLWDERIDKEIDKMIALFGDDAK